MSAESPVGVSSSASNEPTLRQAAEALLTVQERATLKHNLISAQIDQAKYLRAHPEITKALHLAVAALVKEKPEDAICFLTDFLGGDGLQDRVTLAQAMEEDLKWQLTHRDKARKSM